MLNISLSLERITTNIQIVSVVCINSDQCYEIIFVYSSYKIKVKIRSHSICFDLYYLTKSEGGCWMTAEILNLNFNIRKRNGFSF